MKAIHAAGVAFHPTSWNWIRRDQQGSIKIVYMDRAFTVDNMPPRTSGRFKRWTAERRLPGCCREGLIAINSMLCRHEENRPLHALDNAEWDEASGSSSGTDVV